MRNWVDGRRVNEDGEGEGSGRSIYGKKRKRKKEVILVKV